jgi:hypothetical protein
VDGAVFRENAETDGGKIAGGAVLLLLEVLRIRFGRNLRT